MLAIRRTHLDLDGEGRMRTGPLPAGVLLFLCAMQYAVAQTQPQQLKTALDMAVEGGFKESAELLRAAGAGQ